MAFGQNYVNGILFDNLRVGGTGNDQLNASRSKGRNWMSGGLGNDQLYSSAGKLDAFVFYTPPNSQSNTDTIVGFETGSPESDQIWLDAEIFRGLLRNGDRLDTRSFITNISGVATGSSGQIIYNSNTGELFYDADGTGDQKAARFAILSGKEAIAPQDIRLFNQTSSTPPIPPAIISLGVSPGNVKEDSSSNLLYTFTRSGPTTEPLTVNYTIGGSADASDYSGATPGSGQSITFAGGSSTASLTIAPKADSSVEPDETVILTLNAGTGYAIGTPSAITGTITNDDILPVISLAVAPASVAEDGTTNLLYTFSRTGSNSSPLTVNFNVGGNASFNSDYSQSGAASFSPSSGSITFAAGSSTATVTVNPSADTTVEPDETVSLTLTAASTYTLGTTTAVTGTIRNDDTPPPPTLSIAPLAANQNEGTSTTTTTPFTFLVSRSGNTSLPSSALWSVVAGSGPSFASASDFAGNALPSGTVSFAAGDTSRTITLNINADSSVESDESFSVSLANPSGASIANATATGLIRNDDTAPAPSSNGAWSYNWANATALGTPSLLKASVDLPSPRAGEPPLALTALRVDLRDPAISLTSTARTSDWSNNTVETRTQTVRQFISTGRTNETPIAAAINSAPFDLDATKQFQSVPTNIRGFAVSEKQLVSSTDYNGDTFKSTFFFDPITGARIEDLPSSRTGSLTNQPYDPPSSELTLARSLKVATSGFGIVLSNGIPVARDNKTQNARSALGLSADRRYLTMLTVDRKPDANQANGWQGATDYDVGTILLGFGSATGMNLDGGGSTQMGWWNPATNRAELLNSPLAERYVGASLGVVFQPL